MNWNRTKNLTRITCTFVVFLVTSSSQFAAGQLQYPVDVATHQGEIYVIDRTLPGVQKISPEGKLSVVFQASPKFRTPLNGARSIVVDPQGNLVVGDSATRQLYRIENNQPVPLLTSKVGIGIPYAMAYDQKGNLFVADLEPPGRIHRLPVGQTNPETFATQPGIRGLAVDQDGNLIAVTGLADALIQFSPEGKRKVLLGNRPFQFPNSVVIKGPDVFVCDSYGKCVWKVDPSGKATKFCDSGLTYPGGMTVIGDQLIVTDAKARKLMSISPDGNAKEIAIK